MEVNINWVPSSPLTPNLNQFKFDFTSRQKLILSLVGCGRFFYYFNFKVFFSSKFTLCLRVLMNSKRYMSLVKYPLIHPPIPLHQHITQRNTQFGCLVVIFYVCLERPRVYIWVCLVVWANIRGNKGFIIASQYDDSIRNLQTHSYQCVCVCVCVFICSPIVLFVVLCGRVERETRAATILIFFG